MTDKPRLSATTEDSELFYRHIGPVKRLQHDRAELSSNDAPAPVPRSTLADERQVLTDLLTAHFEPSEWDAGEELYYCREGVQHAVVRRLRRGQFRVGAVLDLHGLNVTAARQALADFIQSAKRGNMSCVRIIHGKGRRSRARGPVLKAKVNHWLQQRNDVLAFCSARPNDGGTGALYVLLKI